MKDTSKNVNTKKGNNPLYSIYGVKDSKDGKRFNVVLISGDEDNRQYATISINKKNGRVQDKGNYIIVAIRKLKPREEKKEDENDVDISSDLPF